MCNVNRAEIAPIRFSPGLAAGAVPREVEDPAATPYQGRSPVEFLGSDMRWPRLPEIRGNMNPLYVPTDSKGIEHAAAGQIAWQLPADDVSQVTELGHPLVLRRPEAMLEVLDERIYRAEALNDVKVAIGGTAVVPAARLVAETCWDTEVATRFALDCAEHILSDAGEVSLPDGTSLVDVIAYARHVLDGISSEGTQRLGYLARVRALRRLRHERAEVADLSLMLVVGDEARDVDALDDAAYATVIPVTDSVLAAIEALRHHVLPELYMNIEDAREEHEEHRDLDSQHPPSWKLVSTPLGLVESGPRILPYEPAWAAAREAARHARLAAKDRHGAQGAAEQRLWQATLLASILERR